MLVFCLREPFWRPRLDAMLKDWQMALKLVMVSSLELGYLWVNLFEQQLDL